MMAVISKKINENGSNRPDSSVFQLTQLTHHWIIYQLLHVVLRLCGNDSNTHPAEATQYRQSVTIHHLRFVYTTYGALRCVARHRTVTQRNAFTRDALAQSLVLHCGAVRCRIRCEWSYSRTVFRSNFSAWSFCTFCLPSRYSEIEKNILGLFQSI